LLTVGGCFFSLLFFLERRLYEVFFFHVSTTVPCVRRRVRPVFFCPRRCFPTTIFALMHPLVPNDYPRRPKFPLKAHPMTPLKLLCLNLFIFFSEIRRSVIARPYPVRKFPPRSLFQIFSAHPLFPEPPMFSHRNLKKLSPTPSFHTPIPLPMFYPPCR